MSLGILKRIRLSLGRDSQANTRANAFVDYTFIQTLTNKQCHTHTQTQQTNTKNSYTHPPIFTTAHTHSNLQEHTTTIWHLTSKHLQLTHSQPSPAPLHTHIHSHTHTYHHKTTSHYQAPKLSTSTLMPHLACEHHILSVVFAPSPFSATFSIISPFSLFSFFSVIFDSTSTKKNPVSRE